MQGMIAQVLRGAGSLQPEFQRRLARWLVETVQPLFEEVDTLRAENAALKEKRGPGRPRKEATLSAVGE